MLLHLDRLTAPDKGARLNKWIRNCSACTSVRAQPAGASIPAVRDIAVHFCDHFLSFSLLSSTIVSKYPSGWRVALAAACPICLESYKAVPRAFHEIRVTKVPDSRKDRLHESTYASLHSRF